MKITCLYIALSLFSYIAYAHSPLDSTVVKSTPGIVVTDSVPNLKDGTITALEEHLWQLAADKTSTADESRYRNFPSLETPREATATTLETLSDTPEFSTEKLMEDIKSKLTPKQDSLLSKAENVFNEIAEHQKFLEKITGQEIVDFPVGLKKGVGANSSITIGIISAELHKDYTEVDLFAKVELAELNAHLFFGASEIKISNNGGIYESARLELLADVPIVISGNTVLTIKGGYNQANNTSSEESYVTIDCEGNVTRFALSADIRIGKSIVNPKKEDGSDMYEGNTEPVVNKNPVGDESYVGASFRIDMTSLDDFVVELDLPTMGFKAASDFTFTLEDVVLDMSDTRNALTQVPFPDVYREQQLLVPGNEVLWRGFYAGKVQIQLPPMFRKKNSDTPLSIGAEHLIIDNYGVSGHFYASDIVPITEGEAGKWQFSLDSLYVNLEVNRFVKGGLSGGIVLPVSEKAGKKEDPGVLKYTGVISPNNEYLISVGVDNTVDFDVFKAEATLLPESYIELKVKDKRFYPSAKLSGALAFTKAQKSETDSLAYDNIRDIEGGLVFQNLKIESEQAPYFQVDYMGYSDAITPVTFAGFELGIYDISLETQGSEAHLRFNAYAVLDKGGIYGDTGLRIEADLENNDYMRWKYKRTKIEDIMIDVERKGFSFHGELVFFEENPVYGKGFAGDLQLEVDAINIEIGARGVFGNTGSYSYWYVDAFGRPTQTKERKFNIRELGGGLYHHMQRVDFNSEGPSMSGISYAPDDSIDMGFKALAIFDVGSFDGMAGLEISFNSGDNGGGMNRIGLYGGAIVAKGVGDSNPFSDYYATQKEIAKKEKAYPEFRNMSLDKEWIAMFSTKIFPELLSGNSFFAAQVGIDFDFTNSTYWGMLDVFLKSKSGKFNGGGENYRLGYLEFFDSPTDWYIYIGTPTKRFALKDIPIGPYNARVNFYFMAGTLLPDPALPPANVIDILSLQGDELLFGRNFDQSLAQGTGYAFGGEFALGWSYNWGLVYANVEAGVGFDIMMRDFGEAYCKGGNGEPVGMDGWYATGQLYAYLQGELGVEVKLVFKKIRVPILKAGLAVLARAQMPNPWYVQGYAGIKVRVMGMVTVNARLKVVIGEECELMGKTGVGDVIIISDIVPSDGNNNVDVFDGIQVAFNASIGEELTIEEDAGTATYRVHFDEMVVTENGNTIPGELIWNSTNDYLVFESVDILPSQTDISVTVKVTFEQKVSGRWQVVKDNGQPITEIKEVKFKTGDAPTKIPYKNIEYMYPVVDQKYMLPKETDAGYVQLEKGQDYLFGAEGMIDELYFVDTNGQRLKVDFTYNTSDNYLSFEIPKLDNETTYELLLASSKGGVSDQSDGGSTTVAEVSTDEDTSITTNTIQGSASTDTYFERLTYQFSTSRYDTFKDKIKSIKVGDYFTLIDGGSDIAAMGITTVDQEPFDVNEINGTTYTIGLPMIIGESDLKDRYYQNEIHDLIYKNYPLDGNITISRDVNTLGFPPKKAIYPSSAYSTYVESYTDNDYLKRSFPFRWHLARVYKQDFVELQYEIVNRYLGGGQTISSSAYNQYAYIINGVFPYINVENYIVNFSYRLPGKASVNSSVSVTYKNNF